VLRRTTAFAASLMSLVVMTYSEWFKFLLGGVRGA